MFISLRLFTIVNELMFSSVIQVFFALNTDNPHHDQYVNTMKPYDKLSVTVVFLPDAPNPLFYRNFCVLVERCAYALTNWQQSGIS
ncbi:hypothetical protein SRABI106_01130 [Rahnella aquatilis]|nr:hypothetical protein SRABI106_01130 [Rahnella aquatilis]